MGDAQAPLPRVWACRLRQLLQQSAAVAVVWQHVAAGVRHVLAVAVEWSGRDAGRGPREQQAGAEGAEGRAEAEARAGGPVQAAAAGNGQQRVTAPRRGRGRGRAARRAPGGARRRILRLGQGGVPRRLGGIVAGHVEAETQPEPFRAHRRGQRGRGPRGRRTARLRAPDRRGLQRAADQGAPRGVGAPGQGEAPVRAVVQGGPAAPRTLRAHGARVRGVAAKVRRTPAGGSDASEPDLRHRARLEGFVRGAVRARRPGG
mmetsp:Transcript_18413/g.52368  ORF Transcript_18413/g.52368 Transcript_18413/m.52368 type:complete len:260 (+) Transcript_18413:128-907(+)